MSEMLQEFVDSGHERLRVDRAAGVIRGVKLLGLQSRNGRRYREEALVDAVNLYEGAKVNINHPKGHPLSPRDYQDRLGVVRGVQFRRGDGLFGDLHFNPKHALSEQLVWDAEHAPQNVGMSHNVLARTTRDGDQTVVEAITKVQSIDLVADPATTNGLYEHAEDESSRVANQRSDGASRSALGSRNSVISSLTLEELRVERPDLFAAVEAAYETQLQEVRSQLQEMMVRDEVRRRRERTIQLLQEYDLPIPSGDRDSDARLVNSQFIESLMRVDDEEKARQLVEERAALVRAACRWNRQGCARGRHPCSRDQIGLAGAANGRAVRSAAEFAAAIRDR